MHKLIFGGGGGSGSSLVWVHPWRSKKDGTAAARSETLQHKLKQRLKHLTKRTQSSPQPVPHLTTPHLWWRYGFTMSLILLIYCSPCLITFSTSNSTFPRGERGAYFIYILILKVLHWTIDWKSTKSTILKLEVLLLFLKQPSIEYCDPPTCCE